MIARCSGHEDALRALEYARQNRLPLAIRGGGHSLAALSTCDDGMIIDLGAMDAIRIDGSGRRMIAEPGARIGQIQKMAASRGLVANLPTSPTIGGTGAVIAAGIGDLSGYYGSAATGLAAAHCLLSNGTSLRTDEAHDPDLLWSLRGAGANFAIVTEITLTLFEPPQVYDFSIIARRRLRASCFAALRRRPPNTGGGCTARWLRLARRCASADRRLRTVLWQRRTAKRCWPS